MDSFVDALVAEVLSVDWPVAARAASLRGERRSLSMPDALILATADVEPRVEAVVCADAEWPKIAGLSCRVELLRAGSSSPGEAPA